MKKESKLFKLISFVLIFVLTIVSAFLGTQSFAKYLDEYNQTHGANVATPVVSIENGRLVRTSSAGERYVYDNSAFKDGTLDFYDLKPSDVIQCFFSVNNYDGANKNEVKMKVTMTFRIFLRRLTSTGQIDEYYVVGNTFLVSDDGSDQQDMDGSNFSFYYSNNNSLTNNEGDYISIPLDKQNDKIDSINKFLDAYYDGKTLKYTGNTLNGYDHHLGFIFNPDDGDLQKAFLAKITLPAQNVAGKEYVSARLFISININCEQIQ